MNIFSYLQKQGIDTVDKTFYEKIKEWTSWYSGNVKKFTFYKIYTGRGTYSRKRRKSLQMAKRVCEDIADLLLNERVKMTLSDDRTDTYVKQVLNENKFYVIGNEYQERKAYTGTVAYVPYFGDMIIDGGGNIESGKIKINYVTGGNIYPITWENKEIKEAAFVFRKTVNRKKYVHIQIHRLKGKEYVIENRVMEEVAGSGEGKELRPEEWLQMAAFSDIQPEIHTNSKKPQFVIDRLNIVNNADSDESNPMGIAIFANAIDTLMKMDKAYDSYDNEFELGRKRIFVKPEMMKDREGNLIFDPDDTVFYALPEDDKNKNGEMIQEVNMDLRIDEHSRAINDDLNYLSLKCGFGTNRYRFENGQVKTATEVISENSDMFRTLKKHELILEDAIKDLVRIIIRMGNVLREGLDENTEIVIDFDDSIIEDKKTERETDKADVAIGAMTLVQYRMKWYGETEEQAKKSVMQPREVIE